MKTPTVERTRGSGMTFMMTKSKSTTQASAVLFWLCLSVFVVPIHGLCYNSIQTVYDLEAIVSDTSIERTYVSKFGIICRFGWKMRYNWCVCV
jgi:hypothetical protein